MWSGGCDASRISYMSANSPCKVYIVIEPRSTRDVEIMLFKLIVKVPVVGNTADTPNPPGLLPW